MARLARAKRATRLPFVALSRGLTWRIWPLWRIRYPLGYRKLRIGRILHAKRSIISDNAVACDAWCRSDATEGRTDACRVPPLTELLADVGGGAVGDADELAGRGGEDGVRGGHGRADHVLL